MWLAEVGTCVPGAAMRGAARAARATSRSESTLRVFDCKAAGAARVVPVLKRAFYVAWRIAGDGGLGVVSHGMAELP